MIPITRLTRELKAGGAKTALLGLLVLVGLYFWVPPLWRAVAGSSPAATTEAAPDVETPSPETVPATTAPVPPKAVAWHEVERIRSDDELFRSADATDLQADAFVFDGGFLPIDVEFGETDPQAAIADVAETQAEAAKALAAHEATEPAPLTLKSTLIGSAQRVAIINDRAYAEGTTVTVAGRTWTLLNVESRRVLLDGESGTLELRIDPFAAGRIGL